MCLHMSLCACVHTGTCVLFTEGGPRLVTHSSTVCTDPVNVFVLEGAGD